MSDNHSGIAIVYKLRDVQFVTFTNQDSEEAANSCPDFIWQQNWWRWGRRGGSL